MSSEEDVVAVGVLAERLVEQVDVHRPRERVGDDERRRREVVHLHVGVDPALEVAVAAEHGDDREVLGVDDRGDLLGQRAGVADARRAAVADEVEAERLERLDQAGLLVVLHHDLRAGRERRLDPRLGRQAALDGVAREQPGADHHRRVRRVRARRDRRDHDVAVVELGLGPVGERQRHADRGALGDLHAAGPGARRLAARLVLDVVRRGRVARRERLLERLVALVAPRAGSRRAPSGTTPSPRSARRGPAGASGRRATARRRRGRARASRSTSAPRSPRRATGPAPSRTSRRARRAPASGRRTPGSAASRRRSGRSRRSSRTRATCCRAWRGRRAAGSRSPGRRTRRTGRRRRARAAAA